MKYYLAPLEGITTYVYRRAYHTFFHPLDKYFTPFFVPHTKRGLNEREKNEILPEHNSGMRLIPQIMSNDADGFLRTEEKLREYGYEEINLNLGCPSKTVVNKHRGSGFLAVPGELDRFLFKVYSRTKAKISIKTRLGKYDPEEFVRILEIYNQYPVEELIIHPRVQQDFYRNSPDLGAFRQALGSARIPVCYNGDIFTMADERALEAKFPELSCVMLGRGVIRNPGLPGELKGEEEVSLHTLERFLEKILEDYREICREDNHALFKVKELWAYMGNMFPEKKTVLEKIRKSESILNYQETVKEILT